MTLREDSVASYAESIVFLKNKYNGGREPLGRKDYEGMFLKIADAGIATNSVKTYRAIIYWYADKNDVSLDKAKFKISQTVKKSKKLKKYESWMRAEMIANSSSLPGLYLEFIVRHLIIGPLIGYRLLELYGMRVSKRLDDTFELEIKNGKHTNGRSFGEFRYLVLPNNLGNISFLDQVEEMISIVRSMSFKDYALFINRASMAHNRLAKKSIS